MVVEFEEQHGIQQCIGIWIKMEKLNKTTIEWVPIKDDWCETLIFQYIAIETENGFRIKVQTATYCPSVEELLIYF